MSDQHGPPDADPAGNQPTQPFWAGQDAPAATPAGGAAPGPARPAGPGGPGFVQHQVPGLPERLRKDHRKALHWTAGLLVATLLAGGGMIAGLRLAGHSSPAANGAASGQVGSAQQGVLLNETLSSASVPGALTAAGAIRTGAGVTAAGAAAGTAASAPVCARARRVSRAAQRAGLPRLARRIGIGAARCHLARRRVFAFFLLRGVDGQFTVQTRNGTRMLAFERGVIQSVSNGTSITVKASDGTSWIWDLVAATVVRDRQGKVSQSALTVGTPVWAGGPVVQGVKDARLIVVRPPQPAPVPPSSTPGN
jgi:hypothetical protein